ncbi:Transcriptional regulator, MarR family protein [Minicystis rosea]|nr:Transcriptional regulator, MarR family protein [Minicystis rosea]
MNYWLLMTVIGSVAADISALGIDTKELFLLAAVDDHPFPAELATNLCMPKPTVTAMVKRLEADGFVKREIDPTDLRRHHLSLTASGRKATTRGLAILSSTFGERLSRLSAAEQVSFQSLLEKMS